MNIYYIMCYITVIVNLILGFSLIFILDILKNNNLMPQYLLLYLLTCLIVICLHKIAETKDFNTKYPSTIKSK
jgi:hypothetical protein